MATCEVHYAYTRTFKISFIFVTTISYMNTEHPSEGGSGGSRVRASRTARFVCGSKGSEPPGIWGAWSHLQRAEKHLAAGNFSPGTEICSQYIEHANDRACDACSSLELPATFKHFLHITIISCIICLTFLRRNWQACNPRLPALGGRHDLASSGPAILGHRAGGSRWGARCTEEHLSFSRPAGGRIQLWGLGSGRVSGLLFWASQVPRASVQYFCSDKERLATVHGCSDF